MNKGDGMAEVTEEDREKAHKIIETCLRDGFDHDVIAAALAGEREKAREAERSEWNPMVGRVLQVAQTWASSRPVTIWTDKAAEKIHAAIRGDQ